MVIIYSMVARGSVVLAEFTGVAQTNAGAIARRILDKIPGTDDTTASYSHEQHVFHVKRAGGVTVLCMADEDTIRRIPFAYLEDVHGRFKKTYDRDWQTALAYAMNDEFSKVLSQQMDYYSNDAHADRIKRIKDEISEVRSVMLENIEKVLEQEESLELMADRTAIMQEKPIRMRRQARIYKQHKMWWINIMRMEQPFRLL